MPAVFSSTLLQNTASAVLQMEAIVFTYSKFIGYFLEAASKLLSPVKDYISDREDVTIGGSEPRL